MSDRRLVFIVPPGSELVSGGNIYNRELLAALEALRDNEARMPPIDVVSPSRWHEMLREGVRGTYLVDTLLMDDFMTRALPLRADGIRFILIVHHLPSLEPGLAEAAAGDSADGQGPLHPALALERRALPQFDGFLTTSQYTSELLHRRGIGRGAVMTVPPGLPDIARPPLACPPRMRALMVGNLIARKSVLPFLRALAAQLSELRVDDGEDTGDIRVDIVGRCDLEPAYAEACARAIADSAHLSRRVQIHGPVPYQEMPSYYTSASVLVSASQMETFGMALQEARAYGLPILAYDGGNSRNHFDDGVNGHLYRRVDAIADDIVALARDPARMGALFLRAQRHRAGADYTWAAAAARLLSELDGMPDAMPNGRPPA